jgi:uncharacterized protein YpiB (UPF0302 family)
VLHRRSRADSWVIKKDTTHRGETAMSSTVTTAEKKHFLRWFLSNYQLQSREAEMLMRYMMTRENVLRRVHFVENFRQLPRVVVVSTTCVPVAPFRYYRRNKPVSTDVEQAFLDLYQHPDEDIYVGMFFKDRATSSAYASVLEETSSAELEPAVREMISLQAELVIDQCIRNYHRQKLMDAVNQALDASDRNAFYEATKRLLEFDEIMSNSAS